MSCTPPRRVVVVRCPRCGSTNAGADEARSYLEFTHMQCGECGHGELVDSWQIQFDWNVALELVENEPLPELLEPLAPGEDLAASLARVRADKDRA